MKALCLHPLFAAGVVIRLALVLALFPAALNDWYAPFLQAAASDLSLDPWSRWLAAGGDPLAFPYGYVMWLIFLPPAVLTEVLALPVHYGYWAALAAVDLGLLAALRRLLPALPLRQLLLYYWLSPIVLLASYGLGLNDLAPVLLMTCAMALVRRPTTRAQGCGAGLLCALGISAKLSMIIYIPFFIIYLRNGKQLRQFLPPFLGGLALCAALFIAPFLLSGGGRRMLFGNPEMQQVYQLLFTLNNGMSFYIVPALYIITLYYVWLMGRLNFDLFLAGTGISFLLVTLFASTSPGWFIWNMPFLVFYLATGSFAIRSLVGAFSLAYLLDVLLSRSFRLADGALVALPRPPMEQLPALVHTTLITVGVILAFHAWRNLIQRNDFYRLGRRPFVIGIAGDSGAGKTSLAASMKKLLGKDSVTEVSGDNYHHWDRHAPMWNALTHLHPEANDLERFGRDLASLADRAPVRSAVYDHDIGKMIPDVPLRSNDFLIATGLHTLYSPAFRRLYGLKIYLDMDESLRHHLKQQRDAARRGYSPEQVEDILRRREADARRFIRPQRAHADLVLSLQPARPAALGQAPDETRLILKVNAVRTMNQGSLVRALVSVCSLRVDATPDEDHDRTSMIIEGEASAADLEMVAEISCPRVLELLDLRPQWQDGVTGLMQLIILCHVDQALMRRLA